jgi:hypothetical protein
MSDDDQSSAPVLMGAQLQAFMQLMQALIRTHPDPALLAREFDAITSRVQVARAVSEFGAQPLSDENAAATALWRALIEAEPKRRAAASGRQGPPL